jgi:hypothetical protein
MRRANYARKAGSGQLWGHGTARLPEPHHLSNENNVLLSGKTGSTLFCNGPLNLLGGGSWKWPKAGRLDDKMLANIRWSEIGGDVVPPMGEP